MKHFAFVVLYLTISSYMVAQEMSPSEVVQGYSTALSYMTMGNDRYAEARALFARILPYADDDIKSRIQKKIPMSWYFEGCMLYEKQQWAEAFLCMNNARNGFHELGDYDNEVTALYNMASIKKFQYSPLDALSFLQQAEVLAASIQNHSSLFEILNEERDLCRQLDNHEDVVAIATKMDSLISLTGDVKASYSYHKCMGDDAKMQGDYDLAERWYLKNEAYINQLGDDYIGADRCIYYSNLSKLYSSAGRLDDALRYGLLYKEEYQRLVGKSDKDYYKPYSDLAMIYRDKGDSIRCFQCLDTLFISLDRHDEPREKHFLYLYRAMCYRRFGKYEPALSDYKEADALLASKYDTDDGYRIRLLPLMGGVEHELGHHEETERLYREYADKTKIKYGDNSREYIDALGYLANAEAFSGHIAEACRDYTDAVERIRNHTQNRLPYLTTAEREGFWPSVSELLMDMTPFAIEAKERDTRFTSSCYESLVLSKAFLLETERSLFNIVKQYGTPDDLGDFTKIASMQLKIREWQTMWNDYSDSILELTAQIRLLETRLSGHCRKYADMTSFMGIGYNEIKERLNDGDILIDFTDFVSKSRGRVYAAYLVDNKQENPLLQELFAESKIDSMNVPYLYMFYEQKYANQMLKLLWNPFKDYVQEGATVYYVPSQMLFQIALESLPMEDGTLLGDHYHFVRLSSAREIVNFDKKLDIDIASSTNDAVLYGGLFYDLEAKDWETEAKQYDVSPLLAVRGDIARGDSIYSPLPGSKEEVDAIEQIMKLHQLKVESYTGKRGTEESFLNMSGKAPQILHVATHGFFYTPDEAQTIDYLRGYSDAMSLSGLIMSGGNAAWRGKELPEGVLGGILTAANISRLDLSDTKLTVLSACQSGSGKATSEGLYGLQRAFKKAGVKTMIMSLWNVSDVVGTKFMTLFYENLLDMDNNFDKRAAFEKAKSAIRKDYPDPYYWACFVMLD